jgi:hypothetical protein
VNFFFRGGDYEENSTKERKRRGGDDRVKNLPKRVWVIKFVGFVLSFFFLSLSLFFVDFPS